MPRELPGLLRRIRPRLLRHNPDSLPRCADRPSMSLMKPPRWLNWVASALLLVTIFVTGAHSHHGDDPHGGEDRHCVTCTLAHAPAITADRAPTLSPPATTHHRVSEPALLVLPAPLCAIPSSRAPPIG